MPDPAFTRQLREASAGMVASLGSWGVVDVHWLPFTDDQPAVWLTTRSEAQRQALEGAAWLEGQVAILLTRAQVPYELLRRLRIFVDSEEGHQRLLRESL